MAKSTKSAAAVKRANKFPLFKHQCGRWCKKVLGKHHYFGRVADDPQGKAALQLWVDQKDDLLAGRTPRAGVDVLTVRDLCNRFLTARKARLDNGELSLKVFNDYQFVCALIIAQFGARRPVDDLDAGDFRDLRTTFAKDRGPVTLGNLVGRARAVLKFAYDEHLVEHPIRCGRDFQKPSKKIMRQTRLAAGPKMLEAADLRRIIEAAPVHLRAMTLLALNCGYGNGDCSRLPISALDLKKGWATFPRPKTAVSRRCPLWPETIEAVKAAIKARPKPKDAEHADLVFVTKYGDSWFQAAGSNPISAEFTKLLKKLDLHRPGMSFYLCRHVFETIGGACLDQVAVSSIMGHVADARDMSAHYREKIDDARLVAVTTHVRTWLFAESKETV